MYAIIEDSGTQVKVAPGDVVELDLRDLSEGQDEVTFDRVLAVGGDGPARLGTPYVDGATVTAKVLGEVQGEKLAIQKFKRRKGYKRRTGHRQRYLRVEVAAING